MTGVVFKSVWARNFMALQNAEVKLQERGLVFIEGENLDDTSAASNGAGKSSLVDAISWCLYGITARGVSGDAVINRKAERNCAVTTDIEVDGEWWRIERGRKHKDLKNRVRLFKSDGVGFDDMTLGTDKLTQERIDALLGCNAKTFNDAVYMGQERMVDLPSMTDKMLKATLEQALSLDRLDEAQNIANIRLDNARHSHTTFMNQLDGARKEIEALEEDIREKNNRATNLVFDMGEIEKEIQKVKDNHAEEIEQAKKELTIYQEAVDVWEKKVHEAKERKADALRMVESQMANIRKIDEKESEILDAMTDNKVMIAKHQDYLDHPDECVACGRAFDHGAEVAAQKTIKAKELTALKAANEELVLRRKKAANMREKIREEAASLKMTSDKDLTNAQMFHEAAVRDLKKGMDHLKGMETNERLIVYKKWYEEKQEAHRDLLREILDLGVKAGQYRDDMVVLQVDVEQSQARIDVLEKVKHVLSRKGFRGEVLDQVTPYLNARTQYYLTWLTSDNISAVWNTVYQTSTGDLAENFQIAVTHREGAESFEGLSGGEKRKVRLACAMALQDLVGTRAVKPIKLFIADEIDDAIDESGLELLMGLLEEKAKSVGSLLIISHNALGDWCKESITVTKKDGVSTVK